MLSNDFILSIILSFLITLGCGGAYCLEKHHVRHFSKFPIIAQRLAIFLIGLAFTLAIIIIGALRPEEFKKYGILVFIQFGVEALYIFTMDIVGRILDRQDNLLQLLQDLGSNEQSELSELVYKVNKWDSKKYSNKEIAKAFEKLKKQLQEEQSK